MKQLIPQSKIDEAAKLYSLNADTDRLQEIEDNEAYDFTEYVDSAVKFGIQFALNEIQPFVCEFAEFAYKNYDYIERISNKREWMWKKNNDCFTTQQLLEEFINYKNK